MLAKIKNLGSLAKQIWEIVSFILPIIPAIKRIAEWIEQLAEEAGENENAGEEKKKIVMNIIMEIYDTIDDVIDEEEESIPISRDNFEKHISNLIDIIVTALNTFNIFR